jgi:Tfp pilus assembly protein PilP
MLKVNQRLRSSFALSVIVGLLVVCSLQSSFAQPKKPEAPVKSAIGDFNYTSDNRRDPFDPVYLERVKRSREATSIKRGYELEELKLVGILKTDKNRFAMMEDMQGKGVMFKKGDYLNNNLWVVEVAEGRVVLAYKLKNDVRNINIDIPKK